MNHFIRVIPALASHQREIHCMPNYSSIWNFIRAWERDNDKMLCMKMLWCNQCQSEQYHFIHCPCPLTGLKLVVLWLQSRDCNLTLLQMHGFTLPAWCPVVQDSQISAVYCRWWTSRGSAGWNRAAGTRYSMGHYVLTTDRVHPSQAASNASISITGTRQWSRTAKGVFKCRIV